MSAAILAAVLAVAAAEPGPAADQTTDPAPVLACLDAAERDPAAERACAGVASQVCIEALGGSAEAAGLAACAAAEAAAWDAAIGALTGQIGALLRLQAEAEAAEAQEALFGAAQAAWRQYREADCAQEAAHWGEDPMAQAALSECWLNRSAARALELLAKRRMLENP